MPLGATDPQRSHLERRWGLCDFLATIQTEREGDHGEHGGYGGHRELLFTAENAENTEKPLRGNSSRGDALDRQVVLNPQQKGSAIEAVYGRDALRVLRVLRGKK